MACVREWRVGGGVGGGSVGDAGSRERERVERRREQRVRVGTVIIKDRSQLFDLVRLFFFFSLFFHSSLYFYCVLLPDCYQISKPSSVRHSIDSSILSLFNLNQ